MNRIFYSLDEAFAYISYNLLASTIFVYIINFIDDIIMLSLEDFVDIHSVFDTFHWCFTILIVYLTFSLSDLKHLLTVFCTPCVIPKMKFECLLS